ncbi:MAG: PD-(D/E)XK nuclease family protein, partial [Rickettsiaceae bacterium]|nr:PD-(D/E)XK nuclease family protein [Rickettsiaceae bacterium]
GSYKAGILDNLLQPATNISLTDKPLGMDIKYIEFDNNISEAEFIAANCRHYIDNNPEANIAIIINSSKAKEYYSNCLSKYLLQYNDLIGEDILKLGAVYLLTEVAKLICDEFHLQRFFSLLSDPLVNSVLVDKLKNTIIKNNRFINSYAEIKELVAKEGNQEVINYFTELSNGLDIEFKDRSFNNILKQVIKTTEAIYPKIWQENDCYKLSESLFEILKINWQWQIQDLAEFPEILRAILKGGRVYNPVEDTRITLCKPADVALVNFDLVMMADLNEGSLPANASNNPWLNKHMQEELSIHSWCAKFGSGLYNFYLNLHNKEVVITRAKKQVNNKLSLISTFMLRLKHILGSKLKIENIAVNSSRHLTEENENEKYITVDAFPEYVSATDVELLLRSPYNFYAKKILKLRPEVEIEEKPSLAEFGNFFHNVVDLYNKNYAEENGYGVECLLSIANDILENSIFPEYIKKNWKIKLTAIASEFIEFDEGRRRLAMETYSEIKGKMMLNIAGKDIVVTSIADRIEIDENREAVIIDYKTGAMPSKSEVASGLSPQLVIAALILLQGGFGIEITGIKSLLYVKINHNEPYIKTQAITLTAEELAQHKQGLISLLEYYVNNKIFPVKQAELEYDDYSHLARR